MAIFLTFSSNWDSFSGCRCAVCSTTHLFGSSPFDLSFRQNERRNRHQIFLTLSSNWLHDLDASTNLHREFSAVPFYSIMLNPVCRHLSHPPSVPLHLSLCSLFPCFPLLDGASKKKKGKKDESCRVEPVTSWARTQKYREKRRGVGDKGRKRERERKDCHIDLVILPAMVGGDMGRRVTQRKQALHVRRENTGLPLSWQSLTRKRQHKLCAYMYTCDHWRGTKKG